MPCHYEPGPEDHLRTANQQNVKLREDLDKLTRENDQLREALLNLINDRNYELPDVVVQQVKVDQIEHRKEDLARLEEYFRGCIAKANGMPPDSLVYRLLGLVVAADPTKPLEPQLGFDPDDY